MPKRIDRTGQTFENLTIKEQRIINRVNYSFCKCSCGNEKWIRTDHVVSGRVKSCGCIRTARDKRIGKIYGGLKVLKVNKGKNPKALCKCSICGNEKEFGLNWVIRNNPNSCGCIHISDIAGQKFGFLEPIEATDKREGGSVIWRCLCHNCGKECFISHAAMTQRGRKSCGCCKSEIQRETGKKSFEKGIRLGMVENTDIHKLINGKPRGNSQTGIRGVSLTKNGTFRARINFKKKAYYIGTYKTLEEAKEARETAEKEIYGDFIEWYKNEYPEYWEKINKNKIKRSD